MPAETTPPQTPAGATTGRPRWWREPLLHFLLIGAVLFGVDHVLSSREDDPRTIVIDAAVDQQALDAFRSARGRAPNEDELYALRRVWLDNEVLYREGLALGLDKGDPGIRDRVVFKSLSMINASLKRPPLDEKVLRDWFEANRARYDEPARFDFLEALVVGDATEEASRGFAQALNAGDPHGREASLRVFKGRPRPNLVESYGADFTAALEALTPGTWAAVPHRDGWRVVRLEALVPGKPASFEQLGGVVVQDWTDAVMAEQRTQAVRALARQYTVVTQEQKP